MIVTGTLRQNAHHLNALVIQRPLRLAAIGIVNRIVLSLK